MISSEDPSVIQVEFGMPANGQKRRVAEPEARVCYLALGPGRSIRKVREHFGEHSVSERWLENWSSQNGWYHLAQEHDAQVLEGAEEELRAKDTKATVSRARLFEMLAEVSGRCALLAIIDLDPKGLKPREILYLTELAERAEKVALLIESRLYLEISPKRRHLVERLVTETHGELVETVEWLKRRSA